jgi:hypothetical protein
MAVANSLAYYNVATIAAIKSLIVLAPQVTYFSGEFSKLISGAPL